MSEAAPFISQPAGSFEDAEQGGALFPSSVSDTMDWFDASRGLGRQFLRSVAEGGMQDPLTGAGQDIIPPEPSVAPSVLQEKYGIPGKLTFDRPLPDDVAQSMYTHKREEITRADAIERRPSGLVSGGSRYGAQFMADLLDPVNLAATMVPVAPEIDLGVTAASPLVERIGQRAVQGVVGGAAGMAPLAGLKYAMGRQEQADYDGYSALADIATGAGIGAVLHVGGGALGDYLTGRVRNSPYGAAIQQSPEARSAAINTAVAQMAEDRPVEVRPIFDSVTTAPGGSAPFPYPEETEFGQAEKAAPQGVPEVVEVANQPYGGRQAEAGREAPEPPSYVTEPAEFGVTGPSPGGHPFAPEPAEPRRLASFLISQGGLQDPGGDVLSMMGGYRGRPGLVAANGRTLDDAALNAWQAGYFPEHAEQRPTINELLEKIDEDLRGNPQYSHHDEVAVQNYREARDQNGEILRLANELGIPTQNITREQFFDQVHGQLSQEDFDARVGAEEERHQAAYEEAERRAAEWVAYHGTPHEFDQFDTAHIGTGEGAQAYGHGLYFAENKGVAESYRTQLSRVNRDADFVFDGKEHHADELDDFDRDVPAARPGITAMMDANFDAAKARGLLEREIGRAGDWERLITDEGIKDDIAHFDQTGRSHAEAVAAVTPEQIAERRASLQRQAVEEKEYAERGLKWFDEHKDRITAPERKEGHLYTVHLKAKPEEMLDWDKPLSEQSEFVQKALEPLINPPTYSVRQVDGKFVVDYLNEKGVTAASRTFPTREAAENAGNATMDILGRNPTGGQIYESSKLVPGEFSDKAAAAAKLQGLGIKGIRYADAQSRGAAGGTHNVVVFDHNDVEITHRNGEPVEHHAPTEAEVHELQGQEPHGGFDAERFYGANQDRSLEDLENEYRQEEAALAARQRAGGVEPGRSAPGNQEPVPPGVQYGGPGARPAGRQGPQDRATILNDALRAAGGYRPPEPGAAAADAAAKLGPDAGLRQAQQQIADHEEFFRRADAAGALTEDVRAELNSLGKLDTDAADYTEGAVQAAACVSRGITGGTA